MRPISCVAQVLNYFVGILVSVVIILFHKNVPPGTHHTFLWRGAGEPVVCIIYFVKPHCNRSENSSHSRKLTAPKSGGFKRFQDNPTQTRFDASLAS